MRLSIALFSFLFISLQGHSQSSESDSTRWQYLGQSKNSGKVYLDLMTTMEKADVFGVKQVWVKYVKAIEKVKKGNKLITYKNTSTLVLYEIKCASKEKREKQWIIYSAKGDVISSSESMYNDFERVAPDTIGESILEKSCVFDKY